MKLDGLFQCAIWARSYSRGRDGSGESWSEDCLCSHRQKRKQRKFCSGWLLSKSWCLHLIQVARLPPLEAVLESIVAAEVQYSVYDSVSIEPTDSR